MRANVDLEFVLHLLGLAGSLLPELTSEEVLAKMCRKKAKLAVRHTVRTRKNQMCLLRERGRGTTCSPRSEGSGRGVCVGLPCLCLCRADVAESLNEWRHGVAVVVPTPDATYDYHAATPQAFRLSLADIGQMPPPPHTHAQAY